MKNDILNGFLSWSLICPYKDAYSVEDNEVNLANLRHDVYQYGCLKFEAHWLKGKDTSIERFLIIKDLPFKEALKLGERYNQTTIGFKDADGYREIQLKPSKVFKSGETILLYRNINLAELFTAHKNISIVSHKALYKLSALYLVHDPRPSYFETTERLEQII